MDLAEPEWRIAVALALGLVMGTERERRKQDEHTPDRAGVRTFALAAVLGAIMAQLAATAGAIVAVAITAGVGALAHIPRRADDRDPTTEVALVVTCALGALAQTTPWVAMGTALVVTLLLAVRVPLQRAVRDLLTDQELLDALTFAVAAVGVLPMLPDGPVDPWGAVNPFVLWRLVVIVMALTGAGYIAVRWVGPRYGLFVAGLVSGFVSSTATIGAMGARARAHPPVAATAAAGAAASTVATFVQMGIVVTAARPSLAAALLWPLVAGGLASAGVAAVLTLRTHNEPAGPSGQGRAFSARIAIGFALVVAAVGIAATLLHRALGDAGTLVAAALGGLVDSHAAASAAATRDSHLGVAALAVLVALSTNAIAKCIVARAAGPRGFRGRVIIGQAIALGATWAAWLVH